MTGIGRLSGYCKGLKLSGTGLRTECQSPVGRPLSLEKSLVSLEKKILRTCDLSGTDVSRSNWCW